MYNLDLSIDELFLIEKYRVAPLEIKKIVNSLLDFTNEIKGGFKWCHETGEWVDV